MKSNKCSVPVCDREHYGHGYCRAHYFRFRRTGTAGTTAIGEKAKQKCSVPKCRRNTKSKGMCQAHYMSLRRNNYVKDKPIGRRTNASKMCAINGCTKGVWASGFCTSHYAKSRKHRIDLVSLDLSHCEICGATGKMNIDHDHSCCPQGSSCEKCFRGILCFKCNIALGLLSDDVGRIEKLANYVKTHIATIS